MVLNICSSKTAFEADTFVTMSRQRKNWDIVLVYIYAYLVSNMSNIVMCAACKNSSIVNVREPYVELQVRSCTKVSLPHF